MLILLSLIGILGTFQMVSGGAVVEVEFKAFVNPGGKGANGHCCDGKWFMCFGSCDHFFKICLDDSDGLNNMQKCPYGSKESGYISEKNNIKFGSTFGGLKNPLTFKLNSWPGSVKLKIDVWDSDESVNTHDHVEFHKKVITQAAGHNSSIAKFVMYELIDRTSLRIEFKVYCESEYFGTKCETHCVPRDDSRGHYTCNPDDGSRVCLSGWNGTYCDDNNINECEMSKPCKEPQVCYNRPSGYVCTCPFGKSGDNCSASTITCDDRPCLNGGNCSMVNGSITCTCTEKWNGDNCGNKLPEQIKQTTSSGSISTTVISNATEEETTTVGMTTTQTLTTEEVTTKEQNVTSAVDITVTELSTEPTTTTETITTTIPPPAYIMLKGRLLGDNEEDVRKGIARIMIELLNMKRNLLLKLKYSVFALTNGQIVTRVSIRGTEDGKNVDNKKLQDVLSHTSLETLEQFIPHPIYRESSKSPNAEPLVDTEQIEWSVKEGADFIVAETFGELGEAMLALKCIQEYGNVPAVVSLSPKSKLNKTIDGVPFDEACRKLEEAGAAVVGLNCARGPDTMLPLIREIRKACKGPICMLPVTYRTSPEEPTFQMLRDKKTGQMSFPVELPACACSRNDIAEFAREAKRIGVQYVGICCGNASHYFRILADEYGRHPPASKYSPEMSQHYIFGKNVKPYIANKLLPEMST